MQCEFLITIIIIGVITNTYLNYYNYPQQQQVYQRQIPQTDYSGEKLRGEVIDASTGEPLPFAKITFPSNPNVGAVTDFDGKFEIMVPKNERYVTASYVGYNSTQLSITAPYLKFFIQPQELTLEEVVVSSEYEKYAPDSYDPISVQSIGKKDIQRIPSVGNRDFKKSKSRSQEYMQATSTANGSAASNWSSNAATTVTKKDLRVEYAIQSKFSIPTDGIDHRVHISN
jgi:hypothetical protein